MFVGIGAVMIAAPRPGRGDFYFGIMSVVFFGSGIPIFLARLLSNRPLAVVTAESLSCPAMFAGDINWRKFQGAEVTGSKKARRLVLAVDDGVLDALVWRAPLSWIRGFTRSASSKLVIQLNELGPKADELTALCEAKIAEAKVFRAQHPELADVDAKNAAELARRRALLAQAEELKSFPVVTVLLLLGLVSIYAAELMFPASPGRDGATPSLATLARFGGLFGNGVAQGEILRIFSAPLLHLNPAHILGNGIGLLLIGFRFERYVGSAWFAGIFAISAFVGSLASVLFNPANIISVGASGGIVGLFAAAAIGAYHFPEGPLRSRLLLTAFQTLIPTLAPFFGGKGGDHIDYACHMGGALGGAAMGALLLKLWPADFSRPVGARNAAAASIAFFALGLFSLGRMNDHAEMAQPVRKTSAPQTFQPIAHAPVATPAGSDIRRAVNGLAADIESVCLVSQDVSIQIAKVVMTGVSPGSDAHKIWQDAEFDLFRRKEAACADFLARIGQKPAQ